MTKIFYSSVYPCPETASERREMMCGGDTRLSDLATVLTQTTDHRLRLLVAAAATLRASYVKVRRNILRLREMKFDVNACERAICSVSLTI